MILNSLKSLHQSMVKLGLERYKFPFTFNDTVFDVFFFTDTTPYELLFGAIGQNFSMNFKVETNFDINPLLDREVYNQLCRILGLRYDPDNKFSTSAFLKTFGTQVPRRATARNPPLPHEVAIYRRDVEEADKIYFCGWRNNSKDERVSPRNLEKTLKILGQEAYEMCRERNVSSRWTDQYQSAVEFYLL